MNFLKNLFNLLRPFWLQVMLDHPYAKPPTRNSEDAAGYDLYAVEPQKLRPGLNSIHLGFSTAFPSGWAAQIYDRSSMGNSGFIRHAGLIDSDYRGEWIVILNNTSTSWKIIEPGDRIAQVIFTRIEQDSAVTVESLPSTVRGEGRLGSTGK